MSSGVKVNDDCTAKFQAIKSKHEFRYVIFRISDDKSEILVDSTGAPIANYDDFKKALNADEPRYALIDFQWKNDEGIDKEDLIFMNWCPDTCGVKLKMLYASSSDAIKEKLDGCKKYLQITDTDELQESEIVVLIRGSSLPANSSGPDRGPLRPGAITAPTHPPSDGDSGAPSGLRQAMDGHRLDGEKHPGEVAQGRPGGETLFEMGCKRLTERLWTTEMSEVFAYPMYHCLQGLRTLPNERGPGTTAISAERLAARGVPMRAIGDQAQKDDCSAAQLLDPRLYGSLLLSHTEDHDSDTSYCLLARLKEGPYVYFTVTTQSGCTSCCYTGSTELGLSAKIHYAWDLTLFLSHCLDSYAKDLVERRLTIASVPFVGEPRAPSIEADGHAQALQRTRQQYVALLYRSLDETTECPRTFQAETTTAPGPKTVQERPDEPQCDHACQPELLSLEHYPPVVRGSGLSPTGGDILGTSVGLRTGLDDQLPPDGATGQRS